MLIDHINGYIFTKTKAIALEIYRYIKYKNGDIDIDRIDREIFFFVCFPIVVPHFLGNYNPKVFNFLHIFPLIKPLLLRDFLALSTTQLEPALTPHFLCLFFFLTTFFRVFLKNFLLRSLFLGTWSFLQS